MIEDSRKPHLTRSPSVENIQGLSNPLPVISFFWTGKPLSTIQLLSLASYKDHGHELCLYTYGDIANLPSWVSCCDASTILSDPPSDLTSMNAPRFSDYFRYALLFQKGGIWSDLDIVCLRPFTFSEAYVFATEEDQLGNAVITNCILKAPAGSTLIEQAMEFCKANSQRHLSWGSTGPRLLHKLVCYSPYSQYAKQPPVFCGISSWRWMELVLPLRNQNLFSEANGLHFWDRMWSLYPLDKDGDYAPTSPYERLKALHRHRLSQ